MGRSHRRVWHLKEGIEETSSLPDVVAIVCYELDADDYEAEGIVEDVLHCRLANVAASFYVVCVE